MPELPPILRHSCENGTTDPIFASSRYRDCDRWHTGRLCPSRCGIDGIFHDRACRARGHGMDFSKVRGGAVGSVGCLGQACVFARLRGQATVADDERALELRVATVVEVILRSIGAGRVAHSMRRLCGSLGPVRVLAGTVPGVARGPEGGIGGQMRLRRHRTSGERQRQQEGGGRFDHDGTLCTRILAEVASIMFKIP